MGENEIINGRYVHPSAWVQVGNLRMVSVCMCFSAEEAQRLLDTYNYDRQRARFAPYTNYYASLMANGEFLPITTIVFARDERKQWVLCDGQHRLASQVTSGASIYYWVNLIDGPAGTVAEVYSKLDGGRTRSLKERVKPLMVDDGSFVSGLRDETVLSAVRHIEHGFGQPAILAPAQLSGLIEMWRNELELFGACLREPGGNQAFYPLGKKLAAAPYMAIGAITLRYQERRAMEFWEGLARMSGFQEGDPRQVLASLIINDEWKYMAGRRTMTMVPPALAHVWNKWFSGEQLRILRTPKSNDFQLSGTPYDTSKPRFGLTNSS